MMHPKLTAFYWLISCSIFFLTLISAPLLGQEPFIIIVNTEHTGTSGNTEFTIPTNSSYTYDYEVDWTYDGTTFHAEDDNVTGNITHDYGSAGIYMIAIRGQFPQIYFNDNPNNTPRASDARKLLDIVQWGSTAWQDFTFSFLGCLNLTGNASDVPDLSGVTSLRGAFGFCTSMDMIMSQWDVSTIQNFSSMFREAHVFNQSISTWDVSAGTNFSRMFEEARLFNQPLGGWDFSSATNLTNFLKNAGLDIDNYDSSLLGWWASSPPTGLTLGANGLKYCSAAELRSFLINDFGWTINGDQQDCPPFVMVVKTDNSGPSANNQFTIPTLPGAAYDYQVDWEYDGTTFTPDDSGINGNITHTYPAAGTYTIAIREMTPGGGFPHIYFNNAGDKEKLLEIQQWGYINWESMERAFWGCTQMEVTATDLPDLAGVSDFSFMFAECSDLIANHTIQDWDVSHATDFSAMFLNALDFNQDIGQWNVASGTNFGFMLSGAITFDQNLGNWDLTNATNMGNFLDNTALSVANYDATLNGWASSGHFPTSGVSFGAFGLEYCQSVNNRDFLVANGFTPSGDALTGGCLIANAPFVIQIQTDNTGLSGPDQFTIPTLPGGTYDYQVDWEYDGTTFTPDAAAVSGDITHTYSSAGTYTIAIRESTPGSGFPQIYFNNTGDKQKLLEVQQWGDINWQSMNRAFWGCNLMDITATDLPDLDDVTTFDYMLGNCAELVGNMSIDNWDVGSGTSFLSMFQGASSFNRPIGNWDVRNGISFYAMFRSANSFNQDIGAWDVSQGTDFGFMFSFNMSFNQDISTWNVGEGTHFNGMFRNATAFNQDLGSWNVGKGIDFSSMFYAASAFNQNISGWNTEAGKDFSNMFRETDAFNQNIGSWDLSEATDLNSMFHEATAFNQNIGSWNVSKVTDFNRMFKDATAFNQDISGWDVGAGRDFAVMFDGATAFNQDISNWDVRQGTDFSLMFSGASSFNQNIGSWDVSQGTDFYGMFDGAAAFDQDLSQWDLAQAEDTELMLSSSGLSVDNYDATLIGWAAQTPPNDLTLGASGLAYCSGVSARAELISTYGWTINGDQLDCTGSGSGSIDCPDDRIVIQNDITADTTLSAANTLETDGTVNITAGQNVTFTAGQTITLKPGFTAAGPFSAVIENCPPMMAAADEQIATDQPAAPLVELPSGKNGPVVALEVVPNPAYDQTNLRFDLTEPSTASLTLHSLKGETLRTLLRGHRLAAGRQQISLRTADLPPGLYLVRLQTTQGVQTAKVVVSRN